MGFSTFPLSLKLHNTTLHFPFVMAPLSPKRRKLDHESSPAGDAEDGPSSIVNELQEKKQAPPKPSNMQSVDQSALYAAGQYKSSIFKLQVDEMLAELRPNYTKCMPAINQALHKIHSLIEAIEDREALPVCSTSHCQR